ncbi:MAG TPA: PspC domain-containing protein [Anaerolineaceae bacterium]|nr:PspC domain-containing protein [Anaerolineaceae bacterium]
MQNRLFRAQQDRILGGVCAGLGKYLNIDSVLVRLFFIVFTMVGGIGPLLYIILWIVVPEEQAQGGSTQGNTINGEVMRERAEKFKDEFVSVVNKPGHKTGFYVGVGLVLFGIYVFIKNLNLPWLAWLNSNVILAVLIIIAGAALLYVALRKKE